MGDINFTHDATVTLTKTILFDIDKFIDANVDNPDQVATALSDAEAIGRQALAETNTYTYVDDGNAFSYSEAVSALDLEQQPPPATPGGIDILGNTAPFFADVAAGEDFTIEIVDIDDVNPSGDLVDIYPVPDGLPDLGNGDGPILFDPLDLNFVGGPPLEGNYELATDSDVNYGPVAALIVDLDGSNETTDDRVDVSGEDLILRFPAGTLFGVENEPFPVDTEVELVGGGSLPFLTFGATDIVIPTDEVFEAGDIDFAVGVEGDYFLNWNTPGNHFIDPADV